MNHVKDFLWRGALGGMVGGAATALFQWAITERQIDVALAIEEANSAPGGEPPMFTRGEQIWGGMSAVVLYGLFLGAVFGFAAAILWPRLSGTTAFAKSIRLAGAAFVAWVLVPQLKYPANPPAVGDPDTVGQRTASYMLITAASMILLYLAWDLWQRLTDRGWQGAERFAAVAGGYALAVGVVWALFPANPDPIEVPANLIWHFRIESIGGNAFLWIIMGTAFGFLADRARARAPQPVGAGQLRSQTT